MFSKLACLLSQPVYSKAKVRFEQSTAEESLLTILPALFILVGISFW